jgi:aspartate-semialdehyde dehydrogenase
MVGQSFMRLLEEWQVPVSELRPFASENSLGKTVKLGAQDWQIQILSESCFKDLDIVFFSSGDDISKQWAPKAAAAGAFAIDNSAAFRMSPEHLLIVPEVNGELLNTNSRPQVIANPNCSTIQLVVALSGLRKFGIRSVKAATYQAVSGAGLPAYQELLSQTKSQIQNEPMTVKELPHQIGFNLIPQIGSFNDQGFCSEEVKIMAETKKILGLTKTHVSAFTVRVPVLNAHSEAVWVELEKEISREEMLETLFSTPGLVVVDDPKKSIYPMPKDVSGKDPVYVGRVHRDPEDAKLWMMWVVSDNIKKGAALNGLQIAEILFCK